MRVSLLIRTLSAALLWVSVTGFCEGETIRIAGSDFAGKILGYSSKRIDSMGDHTVTYQMTGSYLGLLKLRHGFADVAFVLQTAEGHPDFSDLVSVPLGYWGVYFAVEQSNPLNEVRLMDLADILQKTQEGLKSEWGLLVPNKPKWTNRLVFVTFDLKETDPAFPVFTNWFFEGRVPENFASMGERMENTGLAGPSHLLVLSSLPMRTSPLRTLAVIQEGQSVGFPPTAESMLYGDYPLRTALHVVVRDPSSPRVRAFLAGFFRIESLKTLEKSGLAAVPENVRRASLLEFDLDF